MASKEIELQYSSPKNAPVSKKGYFVSPIDKGWVEARNKTTSKIEAFRSVGIVSSSITGFAGMSASICMAAAHIVGGSWIMMAGALSWMAFGSTASILSSMPKKKRNDKASQYAISVTGKLIQDWLLKKYSLTVDDSNAERLGSYVNGFANEARLTGHFYDSKGDYYRLGSVDVNGTEEYFVILEKLGDAAAALKPKLNVLTIDAGAEAAGLQEETKFAFTGEAEILHASIVARIQKLSTMDVDADKQYTLNFVAEELADVIEIQKKSSSLDSTESIQSQIVAVLSDLNDELDKLIISELAEFERQLSVKRNHLAERKTGSNSSVKAVESLAEKDSTHV
jgi:hypothetical protein